MTENAELKRRIAVHFDDPEALYQALVRREDDALDGLRVAAAQQGLLPSITSVVLWMSGLGTPPTPEMFQMVRAQADIEIAQLNEAIQDFRRQQEGGDSP